MFAGTYPEYHGHLRELMRGLGKELPGPMAGFVQLHREALAEGAGCLPLILLEGLIVSRSTYPARTTLAGYAGIEYAAESADRAGRQLTVLQSTNSGCC